MGDPLRARLFGYGVPYRVEVDAAGVVVPRPTDAAGEAERLCRALRQLRGEGEGDTDGDWVYSLPFGRCGVQGRPREHIIAYFSAEAYIDVLSMDGVKVQSLATGEVADIEPGSVVRFRARPLENHCVLVAFQTEDRTPLLGHAAPFTLDGEVPDDWRERLVKCHAAFDAAAARTSDGGHRSLYWNASSGPWRKNWPATLKSPRRKSRRGARVRTRSQRSKPFSIASAPCSTKQSSTASATKTRQCSAFRGCSAELRRFLT